MTASSAQRGARIIEALMAAGVRHLVAAPGSRSAPLLLAAADAERQGLLDLHVRVDERSAGYLALGLARLSEEPVAVLTTSGTAAVNLHPALVEAAYLGVPLVAVTADRPATLRGSGANQTIHQRDLFGSDAPTIEFDGTGEDEWDRVTHAVVTARAEDRPVHLNVSFAEPLVAADQHRVSVQVPLPVPDRSQKPRPALSQLAADADVRRGLILVGDGASADTCTEVVDLAQALNWPIISEPSGNLTAASHSLSHGPVLLGDDDFLAEYPPQIVMSVGRIGLHRSVNRLLRQVPVHIAVDVPPYLGRVDPVRTATIVAALPAADARETEDDWLTAWRTADAVRAEVVDRVLRDEPLSGPVVARTLGEMIEAQDLLVVGASWSIRHVSEFAGPLVAKCIANRGTSGIDGVVSTAWGAALAHQAEGGGTAFALLGDLTALYDRNGFLAPMNESRPRLVYVVVDNDGGGIFSSLEQGAVEFATDFERVFGTPHGGDLKQLLAAPGITVEEVHDAAELRAALARRPVESGDVHIVIAHCVDRAREEQIARRARH